MAEDVCYVFELRARRIVHDVVPFGLEPRGRGSPHSTRPHASVLCTEATSRLHLPSSGGYGLETFPRTINTDDNVGKTLAITLQ